MSPHLWRPAQLVLRRRQRPAPRQLAVPSLAEQAAGTTLPLPTASHPGHCSPIQVHRRAAAAVLPGVHPVLDHGHGLYDVHVRLQVDRHPKRARRRDPHGVGPQLPRDAAPRAHGCGAARHPNCGANASLARAERARGAAAQPDQPSFPGLTLKHSPSRPPHTPTAPTPSLCGRRHRRVRLQLPADVRRRLRHEPHDAQRAGDALGLGPPARPGLQGEGWGGGIGGGRGEGGGGCSSQQGDEVGSSLGCMTPASKLAHSRAACRHHGCPPCPHPVRWRLSCSQAAPTRAPRSRRCPSCCSWRTRGGPSSRGPGITVRAAGWQRAAGGGMGSRDAHAWLRRTHACSTVRQARTRRAVRFPWGNHGTPDPLWPPLPCLGRRLDAARLGRAADRHSGHSHAGGELALRTRAGTPA